MIARGLLAAWFAWLVLGGEAAAADPARQVFTFGYLQRAEDPAYLPHRAYTGLVMRDRKPALAGAETALRESRVLARALGLEFDLRALVLASDEDALPAIAALAEQGVRVFLLDMPLEDVTALAKALAAEDVILFNLRHGNDELRGRDCSPVLFHSIPSDAMLMDALAQFLRAQRWEDVLLLQGEAEEDRRIAATFQKAARKFGLNLVDLRPFVLGNDPRVRDRNNIALLTGGVDYDVVFLADSLGEFGRYVPFQTYLPRPVVGSEGLSASAWHWTWERYGAPQLNQRFDRLAHRAMTDWDYAAWAAVKSMIEALSRNRAKDTAALRAFLTDEAFTLDTYKGIAGSYRPWDHQLRQPVLLHTHNAVAARAPLEEFLHQTNSLDGLGQDRPESACRLQ